MKQLITKYVNNKWLDILLVICNKYDLDKLCQFLYDEYSNPIIHIMPKVPKIFRVFELEPDNIRVIIIGQDPYPKGIPNGRAFDCEECEKCEKSLVNINKEISNEYGFTRNNKSLQGWVNQGVFLINTVLTIRAGKSNSHAGRGWENFTMEVLKYLANRRIAWLILGKYALNIADKAGVTKEYMVVTSHPSPLSAKSGFFGSNCFKKINMLLEPQSSINWLL